MDGFKARYDEARLVGYQLWADECVDIADDSLPDAGSVQKSRLQFDARRWALSKALPKVYGDKIAVAGDGDDPLAVQSTIKIVEDSRPTLETFLVEFRERRGALLDASASPPATEALAPAKEASKPRILPVKSAAQKR